MGHKFAPVPSSLNHTHQDYSVHKCQLLTSVMNW